MQDYMLW